MAAAKNPAQVTRAEVLRIRRRLDALEKRADTNEKTMSKVAQDTTTILNFVTSTKTWTGYIRKYLPHAAAVIIGALVSAGYISAETGKSFAVLLGL